LKKLLTYIVLILFIYNLAGYYIVYKGWQKGIRQQIKYQIGHGLKLSEIEVLAFSKADLQTKTIILEWENDDEFRYNNYMYDVVSSKETNDSIVLLCINDHKEKKLLDQFEAYVNQQQDNSSSKHSKPFKILEDLIKDYCYPQKVVQNYREGKIINNPGIEVLITDTFIDVLSPPPKLIV
jgi:hypothetical protein